MYDEIDATDIDHAETDEYLILSIPEGHKYKDMDRFRTHIYVALMDMGFEINGYETTELYIKSDNNIYDGAMYGNSFLWNALTDLYKNGYCVLNLITDNDDIEEINKYYFN